jgi:hypothetical protein
MSQERFQRDDPERTEPVRSFPNAFRDADPWSGTTAGTEPPDWLGSESAAPAADDDSADFVTQGVRKGYDLLREQMDRGQQYAEQMRGSVGSVPDLRSIIQQTLQFYSDGVLLWLDPFLRLQPKQPGGGSAPSVQVVSSRETRASIKLFPGATGPFDAYPLWSRDRAKPPLGDAKFVKATGGGATLQVRVPNAHPADLYMGVITSRRSGQPAGVVTIQVLPA